MESIWVNMCNGNFIRVKTSEKALSTLNVRWFQHTGLDKYEVWISTQAMDAVCIYAKNVGKYLLRPLGMRSEKLNKFVIENELELHGLIKVLCDIINHEPHRVIYQNKLRQNNLKIAHKQLSKNIFIKINANIS